MAVFSTFGAVVVVVPSVVAVVVVVVVTVVVVVPPSFAGALLQPASMVATSKTATIPLKMRRVIGGNILSEINLLPLYTLSQQNATGNFEKKGIY